MDQANIHAARGVALCEFPLNTGYGFADYLLYIDGKAAGVIEAKKVGATLTGVEVQSARYAQGLPASLPAWRRPLPFSYESTGIETHFTQGLDPQPRARAVFAFHRPETLAAFLKGLPAKGWESSAAVHTGTSQPLTANDAGYVAPTFLGRLQAMPPLIEEGLWPAQIIAIRNLENSLKANKPRSLSGLKNRSENLAGRGQILSILQVNSHSIDQKSGEIWTVQADLQPISFKSDRLLEP